MSWIELTHPAVTCEDKANIIGVNLWNLALKPTRRTSEAEGDGKEDPLIAAMRELSLLEVRTWHKADISSPLGRHEDDSSYEIMHPEGDSGYLLVLIIAELMARGKQNAGVGCRDRSVHAK